MAVYFAIGFIVGTQMLTGFLVVRDFKKRDPTGKPRGRRKRGF